MVRYTLDKPRLLERLEKAIRPLHFKEQELLEIRTAFDIGFDTHLLAPNRARGEPYFFHCLRATLYAAKLMKKYGVAGADILSSLLLHDAIEDAEKGMTTPFMVKSQIHLRVNEAVVYYVLSLTKKKPLETRDTFLMRICLSEMWQVLVAKPFDCNDNTATLAATGEDLESLRKQDRKVQEVFLYYPKMLERAIRLIEADGERGALPNWKEWILLTKHIHKNLRHNAWKQHRRISALMKKAI